MGLRDGLERPSSATEPSPLGSRGPRAGQVKTQTNYQVGQYILHSGTKSTPTTCPPNKTPTNRNNNGQVYPVEADDKAVSSVASSSVVAPPSCIGAAPISSYSASPRGTKGGPSSTGSIAGPMSPTRPPPPSRYPWADRPTPGPHWMPDLIHTRNASPP